MRSAPHLTLSGIVLMSTRTADTVLFAVSNTSSSIDLVNIGSPLEAIKLDYSKLSADLVVVFLVVTDNLTYCVAFDSLDATHDTLPVGRREVTN
jgi:hypothetical protein